jgi:hypothetical protein
MLQTIHPDANAAQVWSAMLAVARSPSYFDWDVVVNEAWVDEENRRIEIYRELKRESPEPVAQRRTEHRQWRLKVALEPVEPPRIVVVSQGMGVPAHAYEEAHRYFDEVRRILSAGGLRPPEESVLDSMGIDEEPTLPAGPD